MNRGDVDSVDITKVTNGYTVRVSFFSGDGDADWISSDQYIFKSKKEAFELASEKLS